MSWSGRERNRMFLSLGNGKFVDASSVTDTDFIQDGRALGLLDWDADGQVDMLLRNRNAPRLRLLRNRAAPDAHWLQIQLVGGGQSNRDAIGARVTAELADREIVRSLRGGEGFLSQSSKTLFFGLGETEEVVSVLVRWPDGTEERFGIAQVDQRYRLVQGTSVAETIALKPPQRLVAQEQIPPSKPNLGRIVLISKLPMEEFPIPSFDNPQRKVKDLLGRPTLINFWSTTCAACLEEFDEFYQKRGKLNRRGLQIVTMLTDDASKHDFARKILKGVNMDALAGYAPQETVNAMQILVEEVLGRTVDMPLPVSLLLDERGQLVEIHVGKIRVSTLLRDLGIINRMDPTNPSASALSFGRRLAFADRSFTKMAERFRQARLPKLADYYQALEGRFDPQKPNDH